MCGILGSVNIPFKSDTLDLLAHRGPDDCGIVSFESKNNVITLGHRRLSIVDLSEAGHQPMSSNCGEWVIIFNGEIYNHQELRKRLSGISFRGHSDTETIVNYISCFGIDSVKDFNGIFAFAILDKKNGVIHIARDRYGVKPLYYCQEDGNFIFSSEIRPISRLVSSKLEPENLSLLLRLRYCPSPYTLYDNIFKLRPGHTASFILETGYFTSKSFTIPNQINHSIGFDQAVSQYGNHFETAVKRQLMSDVDIGVLLSGGLDSAMVSHFAVKHYPGRLKTFTVGFEEESEANEIYEARETASRLKTDHYEVLISSAQFDLTFKEIISTIEEPLGTTSTIPLYYLNKLVSKHVKVVLSGQGADEPLGGYARYQGELYRSAFPRFLRKAVSKYGKPLFIRNEKIQRGLYSLGVENVVERFDNTYALFTDQEINTLIGCNTNKSIEAIQYIYDILEGKNRNPVEALMSVDLRMNLSDDLLLLADKISMHFSIEGRVPLLDNDLVDFIESLPFKYRLKVGNGKLIHKKFAEQFLPRQFIYQKKKGFKTPTEKWFREAVGEKYFELLTDRNSKFSTFFDSSAVASIFRQHNNGFNKEKQIFTLISIYYWMEEFL